jgi:hypothetical protein
MTVYPQAIDDDKTIIRIDDNLSDLGGISINQLREAVFALEKTIGTMVFGAKSSLTDRLAVSLNDDGTIRTEALQAVGLATLPITNSQVAPNAGILESKLSLSYSTGDLNTRLVSQLNQINNLNDLFIANRSNLGIHTAGGQFLVDGSTPARHVASQIDINAVPFDARDAAFVWTGIKDKYGNLRSATQVSQAIQQVNDDLVNHENLTTGAHPATAITVDATKFTTIYGASNVQQALEFLDDNETKSSGIDRATMGSNGIPRAARGQAFNLPDGYHINVVPPTPVVTFLAQPAHTAPRDSTTNGDDLVRFYPTDNTNYVFDSMFTNVVVGDIIRINYGNGIEGVFEIASIRLDAGLEWQVRINGYNLADGAGVARIDRPRFDTTTRGAFAVAMAPPDVNPDLGCATNASSVIVGSPRGAVAVGVGFDPNQLDKNHYALYLRLYPTGVPSVFVDLPGIDVTGNLGSTPGHYNLDIVVEETNKQLRKAGYNYRFIAFASKGEYGIMLADAINLASFSIITGTVDNTQVVVGSYISNVIGDATDGYDALGLGATRAGYASPAQSTYTNAQAAAGFSTRIIAPVKNRNGIINGVRRDFLANAGQTGVNDFWTATITNTNVDFAAGTVTVQYTVAADLATQELAVGKTLVVQPVTTPGTNVSDYGRFIIGSVTYSAGTTIISVINGVHGQGTAISPTLPVGAQVRLYFSNDSVSFDGLNLAGNGVDSNDFHRYHEVFVDQDSNTFAVERARMEKGGMTAGKLDTNLSGWRIRQVSPKLSGYRTGSGFNHWVRFVISSWNQTTGEFTGYLCEPSGTLVTKNKGPVVIGKKNHPVRFYDISGVNFIDIEYRENDISPGVVLLPDTTARYADIELFQSMTTDDEVFLLAGVSHNVKTITAVTDLREFGTLSERNFTDSAIRFIEAGERHLHANGIVRGFEYQSTVRGSLLFFAGGMAVVNGKFVAVDALNVKIPDINTTRSTTVQFFICVTELGQLKAVVKSDGQQFFTTDNYFVESLTFQEIVDRRKDLLVLARASVTFSGGLPTSVSVTDARRFSTNESINHYSWSNDDGYMASFRNTDSIGVWVDEYGISEIELRYLKITDTTPSINISASKQLTIKGGLIEVNANNGLTIGTNIKLQNAKIVYAPTSTFVENDIVNVVNNNAAVFLTAGSNNMSIDNCYLYSSTNRRPPYIAMYSGFSNRTLDVQISNNKFVDNGLANSDVAIAVINTDPMGVMFPAIKNWIIDNNTVSSKQTLLITSKTNPNPVAVDGEITNISGVLVDNVTISNNIFGAIAYSVIGDGPGHFKINKNTADVILSGVGATIHPITHTYGLGINELSLMGAYTTISDNKTGTIKTEAVKTTIVSDNIVNKDDANVTITRFIPLQTQQSYGITILQDDGDTTSKAVCIGNEITGSFDHPIHFIAGGTISGNTISGIATGGCGIYSVGEEPNQITSINGNTIQRGTTTISAYISASDSTAIVGNAFDKFGVGDGYGDGYVDGYFGADGYTIIGGNYAAHNINQVVKQGINLQNSIPLIGAVDHVWVNDPTTFEVADIKTAKNIYSINNLDIISTWTFNGFSDVAERATAGIYIPLDSWLPRESFVLEFSFGWNISHAPTQGTLNFSFNGVTFHSVDLSVTTAGAAVYYSNYLVTGLRPPNPQSIRKFIKVWVTDLVTDTIPKQTIQISSPNITWAY